MTSFESIRTTPFGLLFLLLCSVLFLTSTLHAQQIVNETIVINGATRTYLVYTPVNFDPAENLPVLFAHHGGGGTGASFLQFEADFRSLADSERFLAVYPDAAIDADGCRCWNTEGPYDNGIDDVEFADAMIDAMVSNYSADANRMYACGFSLGGSLMWDYGCYLGDRFAAFAVVAANMWEWTYSACSPAGPTSLLHILGTDDFYAPYDGNTYSIATSLQNDYWANINGASNVPTETILGGGISRFDWAPESGCHAVQHFRTQNGGHVWPSFANQSIWEFVSQFDLNGVIGGCSGETLFRRGDVNGDGEVNISDPVNIPIYLFDNGTLSCENATDSNDDGSINLADAIQVLGYLFNGSGPLPAPFSTCGDDPTPDTLECASYDGC